MSAGAARLVDAELSDPAIAAFLERQPLRVVAAGKCAPFMARALAAAAHNAILTSLAAGTHCPVGLPPPFTWITAGHPVPDEGSLAAGDAALRIATACKAEERLVILLSGGASSLLSAPAPPVTLDDKRRTTALLLRGGADIAALNTVRKHLSRIKGGQLSASAACPVLTLALSDVIGDDPSVIASGPTVPDPSRFADALALLDRFGGRHVFPRTVVERLEQGVAGAVPETPKPGDLRFGRSCVRIIGSRLTALDGARRAAAALGYAVAVVDEPVAGEARLAAERLVDRAATIVSALARPACVLAAGETTVTVKGSGRGGRNQELALAAAAVIDRLGPRAVVASAGTDGVDGPTGAAGGLADSTTARRARNRGCAALSSVLDNNDSHTLLDALGDLVVTGPTDTNVGDLQVVLIAGN